MLVSFDLAAVDQAAAPGVSRPTAIGLDPHLRYKAAYEAGRCPHVTSIDLVGLNRAFDEDDRTARLDALTLWLLLSGLAERGEESLDL